MNADLQAALSEMLGEEVATARQLEGGDINEAYAVSLRDGRSIFVKTHPRPPAGMFAAEARGLCWLREVDAIRVPEVIGHSDSEPAFLALELIATAPRVRGFDEQLGRQLAALHAFGADGFGLDHDNFIGRLPQRNARHADWASFYWCERLEPQIERACAHGLLDAETRSLCRSLETLLPERVGPPEPAARLHGDLWGGNLHVDSNGAPCLIDPAVYGGHREMDLAMMRLFGGFGPRTFAAYEEATPLAEGAAERVALYQLYPLLVHVNLFGPGYVSAVREALRRVV